MSGGISAGTLATVGMGLQVAGVLNSAVGAARQASATQAAYNYQAAVNRNNAQIAEWQANDAIERGQKAEQSQRLKAAQLKGTQVASLAARGVALDEGSPLSILQDTDYMNEVDSLTIRDNAAREAWAYRNQAAGYGADASMLSARADAESPLGSAVGSLLTGAGSVASSWYNYKMKTSRG